jgi:hypothetical protein
MPVMQCVACGMEARPKSYHPSSLRAEACVWLVAVCLGLVIGVSSTIEGSTADSGRSVSALSAVVAPSVDAEPTPVPVDQGARSNPTLQVSNWIRAKVALFLRSAWWVLPIPILFSLWRQTSKRDGCPKCRSRKLIPVLEDG